MKVIWATVIVVALAGYIVFMYNSLVTLRNRVRNAWSQIDVQLKRRRDLIPNLVEAVQGYMTHERDVFAEIAALRASATRGGMDPTQVAQHEGMLSGALGRLLIVAENYPALKADANFRHLQEELVLTESKIAFARQFYNDTVMMFNTSIELFPRNLLAVSFRFNAHPFFELADSGERTPVQVDLTSGKAQGHA